MALSAQIGHIMP